MNITQIKFNKNLKVDIYDIIVDKESFRLILYKVYTL